MSQKQFPQQFVISGSLKCPGGQRVDTGDPIPMSAFSHDAIRMLRMDGIVGDQPPAGKTGYREPEDVPTLPTTEEGLRDKGRKMQDTPQQQAAAADSARDGASVHSALTKLKKRQDDVEDAGSDASQTETLSDVEEDDEDVTPPAQMTHADFMAWLAENEYEHDDEADGPFDAAKVAAALDIELV